MSGPWTSLPNGLSLAAVVLLLMAGLATAAADPGGPTGPARDPGLVVESESTRAAAAAARFRARRLAGEETTRARRVSRGRFQSLDTAAALTVASDHFGEFLDAPALDLHEPIAGTDLQEILDDHSAVVEEQRTGRRSLLRSAVPIRTDRGVLDLRLTPEEDGGYRARNGPAVQLFADPRRGLEFADTGLAVRVLSALRGRAVANERRIFVANSDDDTDTAFRVIPHGAEIFFQLRSPDSPERYVLQFDLPVGAHLREAVSKNPIPGDPPQAIEAVRGDESLATLYPPIAFDPDGVSVSTDMRIVGRSVILSVRHRDADVRYPIFVDPQVLETFDCGSGWQGWGWTGNRHLLSPGLL